MNVLSTPYGNECDTRKNYNYERCVATCGYEYVIEQCGCQLWYSESKYKYVIEQCGCQLWYSEGKYE